MYLLPIEVRCSEQNGSGLAVKKTEDVSITPNNFIYNLAGDSGWVIVIIRLVMVLSFIAN